MAHCFFSFVLWFFVVISGVVFAKINKTKSYKIKIKIQKITSFSSFSYFGYLFLGGSSKVLRCLFCHAKKIC